jgi:hypothetical protein
MKRKLLMAIFLTALLSFLSGPLAAQDWDHNQRTGPTLTFKRGSSHKIEQVNGDCDWVVWDATIVVAKDGTVSNNNPTCKTTVSQTTTKFDVLGDDIGYSFEHNGKLIFLFGDTIGPTTGPGGDYYPNWSFFHNDYSFKAGDPIAWSSTQRLDQGLLINYFPSTTVSTLPLLVQPVYPPSSAFTQCVPGTTVPMGADDVPNAGISLNGQIYLVINTNADADAQFPWLNACSVLVQFNEATSTFTAGRKISQGYYPLPENENPPLTVAPPPGTPEGHFVFTSLHEFPAGFGNWGPGRFESSPLPNGSWEPAVLIYGEGQPGGKSSGTSVYLSIISGNDFWSGVDSQGKPATRYFAGFKNGHPCWSDNESDAVPVGYDNPNNVPLPVGPPGYADPGTVSNMSVIYSQDLDLWLMTYQGGKQPGPNKAATEGIYFSYAKTPWGPWATPQLIFNACRDQGFANFIFYYFDPKKPTDNTCPAAVTGTANFAGPIGPTIGDQTKNDPTTTIGHPYAPFMIERFTEVQGDTLKIYYTMSTWNPYTIVKMESDFKIAPTMSWHSF